MRIVVLGATGATGRQVLAIARRHGHHVVALARRPEALSDAVDVGLEVRQADVHEPGRVAAACRDADAVVSALGSRGKGPTGTLSAGARAITDAMPSRVAWMGSFGIGASHRRAGPLYAFIQRRVLGAGFADKAAADEVVSGPNCTIFHPVILTGGAATGRATVTPVDELDRSWRFMPPKVSRADVAAAMIAEVESPAYGGRTVAVF
ncbi:putative NADH-flavin reductase [Micromonospora sp. Llam0]|uniref:NAD(P)-dependent oxidoreductase n=1 Tax=Micromonospora sp. Llam0 TaxID=2485143 RepID=UPI000F497C5F|nr:NAD(P)H-binding protein [Micromonospora sp. Llam0]ROO60656.1 putative NADH-flavin reductase [Micromonospora sp. Llam0]